MLLSAIEKYCNDPAYLDIVIGLIESLQMIQVQGLLIRTHLYLEH